MIWIYTLLIATGFLPFLVILYKINKQKKMKKHGVKTTATVTEVPFGLYRGINLVTIEYPVTETGQVISKKIRVAGIPYSVGDKLPMYYKRENPTAMILDAGKNFIFLIVFTLIIALAVIALCFFTNIATGEM